MGICKIYGTPLQPENIERIQTETGEKCICSACGKQLKALMNQADPSAAATARGYFEQRRLHTTDQEVQAYLTALCGEMITPQPPDDPHKDYWSAGVDQPASANASMGSVDSSFWITCLKVIMAVLFFSILLGGGSSGVHIGQWNFGISHFDLLFAAGRRQRHRRHGVAAHRGGCFRHP